jgi:hypothetical protein
MEISTLNARYVNKAIGSSASFKDSFFISFIWVEKISDGFDQNKLKFVFMKSKIFNKPCLPSTF